mgnify:CR=1 FL=1
MYAMLGISFFMSIMYPTQFSLALKDLGSQTKSGSAFLVMSIVGNACLPQFTAYLMHVNEQIVSWTYVVPMLVSYSAPITDGEDTRYWIEIVYLKIK